MKSELVEEKNRSGQTYRQLAAGVGVDLALAYRAVNRPDSVSFETFTTVAKYLGVEREQAAEIWRAETYQRRERELREEIAAYK